MVGTVEEARSLNCQETIHLNCIETIHWTPKLFGSILWVHGWRRGRTRKRECHRETR